LTFLWISDDAATAAPLELAGEGVRADVAHRGLHRIGLTLVATAATALALATPAAPVVLDKAAVIGLLQRVRDRAVLEIVVAHGHRALALDGATVVGLLQRIRDAARVARLPLRGQIALLAAALVVVAVAAGVLRRTFGAALGALAALLVAPALLAAAVVATPRPAALGVAPFAAAFAARCPGTIGQTAQRLHVGLAQVHPVAALEAARQHHAAVADPDQAADRQPTASNSLRTSRLRPSVMTTRYQWLTPSPPPSSMLLKAAAWPRSPPRPAGARGLLLQRAQHAHGVLALHAEARVHQLVGQVAGGGEQQQAFGVHVQAAHRLPLALLQARQLAEHRGRCCGSSWLTTSPASL
jgi:hypothetical protein